MIFFILPVFAQVKPPAQVPLTQFIDSIEQGHMDVSMLGGVLARRIGDHRADIEQDIRKFGALKSIKLRNVDVQRLYIFDVEFEREKTVWRVASEPPDGDITQIHYWKIDPGTRDDLREFSCVGPGEVAGTIIWPTVIATGEFHCAVGDRFGQYFGGGRGSGAFKDLQVPINIVLRNANDIAAIRIGATATVSGHFFMVNDATIRSLYIEARDAVVNQEPVAKDIILPGRVYADESQGQPRAGPALPPPPQPDPRAELALRHLLETVAAGNPDYGALTQEQGEHVKRVRPGLGAVLRQAGAIKSMTLLAKDEDGRLIYSVAFENGSNQFSIMLTATGQVGAFSYGPHLADQPEQGASLPSGSRLSQ